MSFIEILQVLNQMFAFTGLSTSRECGVPHIQPYGVGRIVGGIEAKPHSWPWQGSLRVQGKHHCGCSVISNRFILTAGHCLYYSWSRQKIPEKYLSVVLGDHDQYVSEGTEQTAFVKKASAHEKYRYKISDDYDISVLELATVLTFNNYVQPVCLPSRQFSASDMCITTGWGDTEPYGRIARRLRQVQVPLIPQNICRLPSHYGSEITDHMICAGYEQGGKDSCQGDSGGPLVCRDDDKVWQQIGLTSWGLSCGKPKKPGVYTRVMSLVDWVEKKTGVKPRETTFR